MTSLDGWNSLIKINCEANNLAFIRKCRILTIDRNKVKKTKTQNSNEVVNQITSDNYLGIYFKTHVTINEPQFINWCYTVEQLRATDVLIINADRLLDIFNRTPNKAPNLIYLCDEHNVNSIKQSDCNKCVPFDSYRKTYAIKTEYFYFLLTQPSMLTKKNFINLRNFLKICTFKYKIETANVKSVYKMVQMNEYKRLMKMPVKNGSLSTIRSGKLSFLRKFILGRNVPSIRFVITIDCNLNPGEISIPKSIYDQLKLPIDYAMIKRDPSINTSCIYVVRIKTHDNIYDNTAHLDSWMCTLLNADQDGDEVPVYFCTAHQDSTVDELQAASWQHGYRNNMFNESKFVFSQYHILLLHSYDKWFIANSEFWKLISNMYRYKTVKQKCKLLIDLGCTICKDEFDDFVSLVLRFQRQIRYNIVHPLSSLYSKTGLTADVVNSTAKGNKHIQNVYLDWLYNPKSITDFNDHLKNDFNKFVNNGKSMSEAGVQNFSFLYAFNDLNIEHSTLKYKNETLVGRTVDGAEFIILYYNLDVVDFVFDSLLMDDGSF